MVKVPWQVRLAKVSEGELGSQPWRAQSSRAAAPRTWSSAWSAFYRAHHTTV